MEQEPLSFYWDKDSRRLGMVRIEPKHALEAMKGAMVLAGLPPLTELVRAFYDDERARFCLVLRCPEWPVVPPGAMIPAVDFHWTASYG